MDVFEAMGTCRAMRHLKPDPVPDELIDEVIWAATRAPSPGNSQGWDFVVVTDQAKRAAIGAAVRDAMGDRVAQMPHHDRTSRLMLQGTQNLIDTLGTAPVIILVCGPVIYPYDAPREQFTWSALYPAAQNILLAARALGLGTVFTSLYRAAEPAIRAELGIPEHIKIAALIPMGWPARDFGPVNRQPVERFVHRDGWEGEKRHHGPPL
ncbi:MAG: nitroreductase family protein [Ilumatobacter sp.]|nr:nitroreductase family protein [Ilumatobacter sp.]MCB0983106.1 nitroreductase family protein [Ilumatobacter sp.]MCB9382515.1 nitroreductase family protein [Acidimicrobiaceae bacterium]